MKRLIAVIGCVGLLAFFVALAGFIQTGAFAKAVQSGTVNTDFIHVMYSGKYYRLTLIYSLIALGLAVMDIRILTTYVQTTSSHEPQPKDHPYGFLAVRARRYFLVLAGLLWVSLVVVEILEEPAILAGPAMFILFCVLFGLSRRPLNKTIYQLVKRGAEEADDTLASFCQGEVVHTRRDRREQGR